MADPGDELERILADARAQLGRIRLDLPELEDGTPSAREVADWARTSLAAPAYSPVVAPAPPQAAEPLPSVPLMRETPDPVPAAEPAQPAPEPPPTPPAKPSVRPAPPERRVEPIPPVAAGLPAGRARRLWGAGAAAAVLGLLGAWAVLRTGGGAIELPFAAYDALTVDDSGGVIAARASRLERGSPDGATSRLAELARPLSSLSWAQDGLYGTDETPALLRWRAPDAPPDRFILDHAPRHIFANGGSIWTQDAEGSIRQFLLNRSMTGVYLQPLDRARLPGGPTGPFFVDADGAVLALDAQGVLLRYAHADGAYTEPSRGRDYGRGAVLVPGPAGARVLSPRADGAPVLLPL